MLGYFTTKQVARYVLLPELMGRTKQLITGGFGFVPFFIATVYQMVGLLPRNHPYLMQHNIGRFGIHHVVGEAARNVKFSLKHIDQVLMFFAVMAGIIIFFMQFLAFACFIAFQPAAAMPTNWLGFFVVAAPEQDIAYMMLDMVFGVPLPGGSGAGYSGGFFQSCISMATPCQDNFGVAVPGMTSTALTGVPVAQFSPLAPQAYQAFPFAYHDGLHRLFSVYSNGLLVIAVGITAYFMVTVVAETAQSGTPFGKRFNKIWAPVRIVVAFGLLIPLTVGLNSSQYLVLYAAKYGSAFATNGWNYFNTTLTTAYLGDDGQRLVAYPNSPELIELSKFLFVSKVCKHIFDFYEAERLGVAVGSLTPAQEVRAYALGFPQDSPARAMDIDGTGYNAFNDHVFNDLGGGRLDTNYGTIVFGVQDQARFSDQPGFVKPVCGQLKFLFTDPRYSTLVAAAYGNNDTPTPASDHLQRAYYKVIQDFWTDTGWNGVVGDGPTHPAQATGSHNRHKFYTKAIIPQATAGYGTVATDTDVDGTFASNIQANMKTIVSNSVATAVTQQVATPVWGNAGGADKAYDIGSKGWAAAGIWYNRIAEMNGVLVAAVYGMPRIEKYPLTMEKVAELKTKMDSSIQAGDQYKCEVSGVDDVSNLLDAAKGSEFACALYKAYDSWSTASEGNLPVDKSGNPILAAIKSILGLNGLYQMRENPSTHPLAMLSAVGRSLVESSINTLTISGLSTIFAFLKGGDNTLATISSFLVMISMLGLTVGFVLFYVVPFLPFIYYFFAVGGWVKGIFEAMVGAPLWALAHIRIDGNGLPGNAALNGYFLIFEVFLRPILIVFGLLASISTYSALVNVLNNVFTLVTENVGGYDIESELIAPRGTISYMRSSIDQFFFTVIYAIIVYMLGMASFKLIDMIPNNILRWMGQSVATFGDQREDPAQGLVSKSAAGSQQVLSKLGGGMQGMTKAMASERG